MWHDRILVIEDNEGLGKFLQHSLGRRGCEVRLARSPGALRSLSGWLPDEIILDIDGWNGRGLEVCREIAADPVFNRLPLLAASEFSTVADRCAVLDAGALDIIANPPDLLELEFKVKAHTRLYRACRDARLRYGDLLLDRRSRTVILPDRRVDLTDQECRLLAFLADNDGRPVATETALVEVFGHLPRCGDPEIVRDKIRHLRRKLEIDPARPARILTRAGMGYYLRRQEPSGQHEPLPA
ncbi:MAG: response regulator transcription factor [Candidatus Sericytochromatia bacterium]|nr:response regulator transcription factor [Candidatus Tanganyikabacteria bacterium]